MIRQMDMVFIFILMEQNMREIGKMICKMDMELKFGQMAQNMMVIIKKGKKMEKVFNSKKNF